ncbi:sodium/hydrogen exchanger [Jaminaea rosea]|uniref:Sodium/hydrogen exchanger n=1 Tax=Jaminaea rosea TaxID=1569628 RepID=A0A316UT94_9BASI|nr:sodium/hydrogen exchanger [Jaminaea rosea]PWN28018.1 sodium/hydrogen exchanger [Jaminaea rosea]
MVALVATLMVSTMSALSAMAQGGAPPSDPSPSPAPAPPPPAEEQERFSSLALFLVLSLLIFSFFASYYLRVKRITAIHETIVGLFAGMLIGAVLRIGPGQQVQQMLSFSNTIMLNVLLPPIILASGYDLRQESFFRNFGIILAFAFAGTFISAIVIGVLVYLWSLADFTISLSILECLIFGSTLSATDPVTILSIFNSKKVDPTLYSIIFGESLLNDAVSIVMFDTLSTFRGQSIGVYSIFHGFGLFLVVFSVSMALGVAFGLACSLMLKHSRLAIYPQLESSLVALIAYTSYFFSNAVTMSGIVSLLFCGITLKHYAYHNMSRRTQRATRYTFQTLASLSENFIFIYLGLSLFTQENLVFKPLFIVVTVASVVFSRYAAVFPIASLINLLRRVRNQRRARRTGGGSVPRTGREDELSREYQIMLFWAGLRGAVGFALSAGIEGKNAPALQTTVLVTIVLTLIAFGGTTGQMLDVLGIRTGVQDDEGESSDEEGVDADHFGMGAHRRSAGRGQGRRQAKRGGGRGSSSAYRDDEQGFLSGATNKSRSGGGQASRYSYDEDASETNEFSPPDRRGANGGSRSAMMPMSGQGSRQSYEFSPEEEDDDDGIPSTAPPGTVLDATSFLGSNRASGSARALLERGALIMRDGQWFQRIDDRYLKPYFSNAVASRKHEERRSARAASRSWQQSQEQGEGEEGGTGEGGTAALWEAEAAAREPDAEIFSGPLDEEDDGAVRNLGARDGSRATTPVGNGNGRTTPRSRSSMGYHHSAQGSSSSGIGGAFAP